MIGKESEAGIVEDLMGHHWTVGDKEGLIQGEKNLEGQVAERAPCDGVDSGGKSRFLAKG